MAAAVINTISPNPIPTTNFANSIHALLEYLKSSNSKLEKSKLFEADDLIYLLLTLNRMPTEDRTNPHRIPIPKPLHPFVSGSTSICIILDDSPNSSLLPESAREQIKARNLPIDHVIGLWELKSDYKPYESRRKLCHSYDLFFADRKILPMLPRFLGKQFFKSKKLPLAVDFSRVGWAEQIKAWCGSSLMYMGAGTCSALKVGRLGMSEEDILENTLAVIEKAVDYVPKKWGGLRSVHVKTVYSVALPIYQVVPDVGLKIEGVWDEEKKKRLADGKKKKRERDGDGKKERKVKKGRIGYVNCLVEAIGDEIGNEHIDDEVGVENVDGVKKVEKENDETNGKVEKGKKRKIRAKKADGLETKDASKKKGIKGGKVDADASEMSKKRRESKDNKADTEASEMSKKKKKQNKGEKTKKVGTEDSEMSKKRKQNKGEKAEFEANETSKKKKVNKDDEAETETSKKKQLKEKKAKDCHSVTLKKRKSKKGDEAIDNARAEENVEDELKEVVRSDLVEKKKKKKKTQKDGSVAASVGEELKKEQKEDVCSDLVGKKNKIQKSGGVPKKGKSKKSE